MTDRDSDASTVGSDEEQPHAQAHVKGPEANASPKLGRTLFQLRITCISIQSLVDDAHGIMVKEAQKQPGRTAATLQTHINSVFKGNTEEGTRTKQGDWVMYVKFLHDGQVPSIEEVIWPPAQDDWVNFLLNALVLRKLPALPLCC